MIMDKNFETLFYILNWILNWFQRVILLFQREWFIKDRFLFENIFSSWTRKRMNREWNASKRSTKRKRWATREIWTSKSYAPRDLVWSSNVPFHWNGDGYYLSRIRSRIRGCNTIINNATNIHLTTLQETRDENYFKK